VPPVTDDLPESCAEYGEKGGVGRISLTSMLATGHRAEIEARLTQGSAA
jgi:hypothetical protein